MLSLEIRKYFKTAVSIPTVGVGVCSCNGCCVSFSYCCAGVVERNPGQEESQAEASGCRYYSQVQKKKKTTLTRAQRIFQTAFYIKYMLLYWIKDKMIYIFTTTGSSRASSTATRSAVQRTSTSWTMFATHSWWSCTGTFPKTSWTKAGPRPQLLSPRYTGGQKKRNIFEGSRILFCFFQWCKNCGCLQASEHLRKLCMQNMVWSYCKKISPEWKHQVSVVSASVTESPLCWLLRQL